MSLLDLFTWCAIVGGVLFGLKTILQFVGGDIDGGTDIDVDVIDGDLGDSDLGFKMLSLHGLTAFLLMFGLAGRASLLDGKTHGFVAVGIGSAVGVFSVWLIAWLFRVASKLQSSGTVELGEAKGKEGVVYLGIPAGETGKVQITVAGRLKVLDAQAADAHAELKTGTPIVVTRVHAGELLIVEPISEN